MSPADATLLAITAWMLCVCGAMLIVTSGARRLPQHYAWTGIWLTLTGIAMLWSEPPAQIALLAAGAAMIAAQHILRRKGMRLWRPIRGLGHGTWGQEAALRRLCGGDSAVVERLITMEMRRDRKLSRGGAALAAATRLRRDK